MELQNVPSKPKGPRELAREMGLPVYFTGRRCAYGHVSERYTSTGSCVECMGKKYVARKEKGRQPAHDMPPRCECCGADSHLYLDHCHETGVFRGWLCASCNTGLGLFGDTVEGVRNAVKYLERWSVRQPLRS